MARFRHVLTAVALGGALALAACAGGDDDAATEDAADTATNGAEVELPLENATVEAIPETETQVAPARVEDDEPAAANASVTAPPPDAPIAEEEQIIDDAEASGMTSRLPADDGEATGNEAQPAE